MFGCHWKYNLLKNTMPSWFGKCFISRLIKLVRFTLQNPFYQNSTPAMSLKPTSSPKTPNHAPCIFYWPLDFTWFWYWCTGESFGWVKLGVRETETRTKIRQEQDVIRKFINALLKKQGLLFLSNCCLLRAQDLRYNKFWTWLESPSSKAGLTVC